MAALAHNMVAFRNTTTKVVSLLGPFQGKMGDIQITWYGVFCVAWLEHCSTDQSTRFAPGLYPRENQQFNLLFVTFLGCLVSTKCVVLMYLALCVCPIWRQAAKCKQTCYRMCSTEFERPVHCWSPHQSVPLGAPRSQILTSNHAGTSGPCIYV